MTPAVKVGLVPETPGPGGGDRSEKALETPPVRRPHATRLVGSPPTGWSLTMAKTTAKQKAPKAAPRDGTKPGARPKKAPPVDGLTRAQIERANAAGPGAVADLIRGGGGAKGAATKPPAKAKGTKVQVAPAVPTKDAPPTAERDPRLPKPGTVLTRAFGKKEIKVTVLDRGFEFDGKTWRSLSAIAKAVTGTSWNGFLAFGLMTRATKPAATPETK